MNQTPGEYWPAVVDQYAEAIVPLAEEAGRLAETLDELERVEVLLREHGELYQLVDSGRLPTAEVLALLERIFRGRISDLTCNCLLVITRHNRLGTLRDIVRACRRLYEQRQGRVHAQVVSAVPLDEPTRQAVAETVSELVGRELVLEFVVDGSILGGIRVRVGDEVYDASVVSELQRMKAALLRRRAK